VVRSDTGSDGIELLLPVTLCDGCSISLGLVELRAFVRRPGDHHAE
jgi:hypothetical protein